MRDGRTFLRICIVFFFLFPGSRARMKSPLSHLYYSLCHLTHSYREKSLSQYCGKKAAFFFETVSAVVYVTVEERVPALFL